MIFGKKLDLWKLQKQSIISEAPDDLEIEDDELNDEDEEETKATEYQLDDENNSNTSTTLSDNKEKDSNDLNNTTEEDTIDTEENKDLENNSNNKQMDNNDNTDLNMDENNEESDNNDFNENDLDDNSEENEDDPDSEMGEEESTEETDSETERLKKIVLLQQYKELINLNNNLLVSIQHITDSYNKTEQNIELEYALDSLEKMKNKISFTVEQKFLTSNYIELLKLFYYFKYGLNNLSIFIENLLKEKTK